MKTGQRVAIRTPRGTPSEVYWNRGVVLRVVEDQCRILFDCKTIAGIYDQQWIKTSRLEKI